MTGLLAGTAVARAGILNVGFLHFCFESCHSGHDNTADIPGWAERGCAGSAGIEGLALAIYAMNGSTAHHELYAL